MKALVVYESMFGNTKEIAGCHRRRTRRIA